MVIDNEYLYTENKSNIINYFFLNIFINYNI
jgi:hypothetical protein